MTIAQFQYAATPQIRRWLHAMLRWTVVVLSFVVLSGCGRGSDPSAILEDGKVDISGEQVAITPDQVLCGEKEGLWKIDQESGGALAHLTPQGRALGFADDVVMGDTHFHDPYAQVSGVMQLKVAKVAQIVDDDPTSKTVTANIGVVIKHTCFRDPLPMHGADAGAFSQQAAPRVRLRNTSGWKVDRILH